MCVTSPGGFQPCCSFTAKKQLRLCASLALQVAIVFAAVRSTAVAVPLAKVTVGRLVTMVGSAIMDPASDVSLKSKTHSEATTGCRSY